MKALFLGFALLVSSFCFAADMGMIGNNPIQNGMARPTDSKSQRLVRWLKSGSVLKVNKNIVRAAGREDRMFFKDGAMFSTPIESTYSCTLNFISMDEDAVTIPAGTSLRIKEIVEFSDQSGTIIYFDDMKAYSLDCGNPVVSYPYIGLSRYDLTINDFYMIVGKIFTIEEF